VILGHALASSGSRRFRPIVAAMLLMLAAVLWPVGAGAAELAAGTHDHGGASDETVIFGLTTSQLAIAAVVGTGLGATAAIVGRRMSLATGLGVLATVYIAHLGVEALIVGAVYLMWPSQPSEEPDDVARPTATDVRRISGLSLATSSREATP
jgi:hypothetical protein